MEDKLIEKINFVKEAIENNMIFLILGSLISADNLTDKESYLKSIKILNEFNDIISSMNDLSEEEKNKYLIYVKESLEMLQKEFNDKFKD